MPAERSYESILAALRRPRPCPHRPAFAVRKERLGWRVFDGGAELAFFDLSGRPFFDLWGFSPFEPPIRMNPGPIGAVRDLYTLHNTVVNLPFASCRELAATGGGVRAVWAQKAGAALRLRLLAGAAGGPRIAYEIGVRYDPAWGRYRYTFDADARTTAAEGFEPLNMMMAGALESRPERRRWSHSVWEDPQGRLRRVVHSNALFQATDYADPAWRTRNAPTAPCWIGYAAHETFNPAMLIHESSAPVKFATCSQLFDEHVIWHPAGQDDLDEGLFRFRLRAELVNVPAALAGAFLERAMDPPRPRRWRAKAVALPFAMDRVNSFERPVDPWAPETCPILVLPGDGDAVAWASDAARTGRRSIRLRGASEHGRVELFPTGAVCNVQPGRRYRLSGWLRTRGVRRFARLELASYEYTYRNVVDAAHSAKVTGTRDWTRVTVELDSGEEAYLMPRLFLYGPGTAWFDDVALEEVRA